MPMTHSQIRLGVDPIQSKLAQSYAPNIFNAGSALFPNVPVNSRSGKIPMWGKEAFQIVDTERAPGTVTKRTGLAYSSQTYALIDHALNAPVAVEDMEEAAAVPGIDLATPSVQLTQDKIMLSLEKEKADLSTTVAAYPVANTTTLSGTSQWSDYVNSDPADDFDTASQAIEDAEGVPPNTCVMSVVTARVLRRHPDVIDYVKAIGANLTKVTDQQLADFIGVENLVITSAHYTDTSGANQYFWGKDVVLAYVNQNPTSNKVRSYGYTYNLKGYPFVKQPWFDENSDSWIYGTKDCRKPVLTAAGCGYLIKDAVA